jgi:cation:H+ antiporter
MSDGLGIAELVIGVAVSLTASWLMVASLERLGHRLGLSDALLGMVAALAADGPEITAAVTALLDHSPRIGAGVVIGSNVFNLAALLGLSALVAGAVALHRRVIAFAGTIGIATAVVCLLVTTGTLPAWFGLLLALALLASYTATLAIGPARLQTRRLHWLAEAVSEEELELHPSLETRSGGVRDLAIAVSALAVVVVASVVMEHAAARLGDRHGVAQIVIGGLVLAAVTSLPNAVAAVHLARHGRGAAVLSTALNSNAINVTAGLLLPGTIVGLGSPSSQSTFVAVWYLALTTAALALAYAGRGLRRPVGMLIVAAYAVFAVLLCTST